MALEASALARQAGVPSESDYQSFCAALSSSARGREFLAEFTRRNRNADTAMLLAAIDRLEALMRADGTALERLRDELRLLLVGIRLARPDIDAASPLTKAAKLATLLDQLESRIDSMIASKPAENELPEEAVVAAAPADIARLPLSVVPPADEPELPIPSPAGTQPAPITLVHTATTMPVVAFVDGTLSKPETIEQPVASVALSELPLPESAEIPAPKPALPRADPLAAIMAFSEAERIALFS